MFNQESPSKSMINILFGLTTAAAYTGMLGTQLRSDAHMLINSGIRGAETVRTLITGRSPIPHRHIPTP